VCQESRGTNRLGSKDASKTNDRHLAASSILPPAMKTGKETSPNLRIPILKTNFPALEFKFLSSSRCLRPLSPSLPPCPNASRACFTLCNLLAKPRVVGKLSQNRSQNQPEKPSPSIHSSSSFNASLPKQLTTDLHSFSPSLPLIFERSPCLSFDSHPPPPKPNPPLFSSLLELCLILKER